MISPTLVHINDPRILPIDKKEVMRYLKMFSLDKEASSLIDESIESVYKFSNPRATYIRTDIKILDDIVDFGFDKVKSVKLAKNLCSCNEAYVVGATLGLDLERMLERLSKTDTARCVVCSAVGSALIESFCDYVNNLLAKENNLCPRFSPGYGDFLIAHQPRILEAIDASKKIGVSLTDNFMMIPTKSVTAIIGIKEE